MCGETLDVRHACAEFRDAASRNWLAKIKLLILHLQAFEASFSCFLMQVLDLILTCSRLSDFMQAASAASSSVVANLDLDSDSDSDSDSDLFPMQCNCWPTFND